MVRIKYLLALYRRFVHVLTGGRVFAASIDNFVFKSDRGRRAAVGGNGGLSRPLAASASAAGGGGAPREGHWLGAQSLVLPQPHQLARFHVFTRCGMTTPPLSPSHVVPPAPYPSPSFADVDWHHKGSPFRSASHIGGQTTRN